MSKEITEHIEKILKNLPKTPGVYQMKDKTGKVMYVGKAKNLKSRVSSYFVKTSDLSLAKRQMVGKIADIEILHCQTEVEALVLETNIIKHLTPKYNILMKDDKNLAYLKITRSSVPELIKTRQKIRDGGEYFGPYVSGVEESVRALRRIFRIRNCRVKFGTLPLLGGDGGGTPPNLPYKGRNGKITITDKAGKTIPCMDYYIGLCPGPCLLEEDKLKVHEEHIDRARSFLSGNSTGVFDDLEREMRDKAKEFKFEEAQKIKSTIEALRGLHERQKVRDIVDGDLDIFMKYEKYEKVYIGLTQVRGGKIVGVFRHEAIIGAEEEEEIITGFLMRQYIDDDIPDILITAKDITDEAFLAFLHEKKIRHEVPKIGPKYDLIEFTLNQLRDYAYKKEMATLESKALTREHMVHILERLGYVVPEKGEIVFECYDISHTDGHFTYASRVSIVNGKPDTSRYKKYKIKSLADGEIDDFASHQEVMYRRTLEGLELGNFPHLIIIDGGKGQLSSAMKGIKEGEFTYNKKRVDSSSGSEGHNSEGFQGKISSTSESSVIPGLPRNLEMRGIQKYTGFLHPQEGHEPGRYLTLPQICSIAKREEEVFLPGKKDPIMFEKGTPELMVIQKARDESHRFSITANKNARMKSMKKNILEELPGFGPVTRKKLLKLAGSIDDIKKIPFDEIKKICTNIQIETLKDHGIIEYNLN